MQRAMAYGAVPKANCTIALSRVLEGVPGFESLPMTWFPKRMMEGFAELPGVSARTITDDDADENHGVLLVQAGDPRLEDLLQDTLPERSRGEGLLDALDVDLAI